MADTSEDIVSWTFGNERVTEDQIVRVTVPVRFGCAETFLKVLIDAVHPERRLCKRDAQTYVKKLVCGLKARNEGQSLRGEVICVHSFNDIFYPILYLGIIGSGGVFTGTNPAYTSSELAHHFRTSNTRHVLTEPEQFPMVRKACAEVGIPLSSVFILDFFGQCIPMDTQSWTTLLDDGLESWVGLLDQDSADSTVATLHSTSGTTGMPKMAARSHRSLVTECVALLESEQKKPYIQIRLMFAPFFHAFASPLVNMIAIAAGVTTYVMRRYDEAIFLSSIGRYQITETAVVPPILIRLVSLPYHKRSILSQLQTVWCGGAPLHKMTQHAALGMFARDARIVQVWGMTECGWISTFSYPESDDTGSVGRMLPGTQAKIIDDEGNDLVNAEARGEVLIKSPSVMKGYQGNPKATKESITPDGWLRTGDVAFLEKGKVYIVDRIKELIKVRGWQIAPAELEGVLLTHPAIVDAAVIGVQIKGRDTETPRAYVVLRSQMSVGEDQIKSFLMQSLAKYKILDCEIRFRHDIPKSPSGKILRKILREEAAKEVNVGKVHSSDAQTHTQASYWSLANHSRQTVFLSVILLGMLALGARELTRHVKGFAPISTARSCFGQLQRYIGA